MTAARMFPALLADALRYFSSEFFLTAGAPACLNLLCLVVEMLNKLWTTHNYILFNQREPDACNTKVLFLSHLVYG